MSNTSITLLKLRRQLGDAMNLTIKVTQTLAVAIWLSAGACGGHEHEDIDVEGCEHLEEGPAVSVVATAEDETAPVIAPDHKRYDITFLDGVAGKVGKAKIEVVAGDYVFFMNADTPLALKALATGAVAVPRAAVKSSKSCSAIRARYTVGFASVGTYLLDFGPTTLSSVGMVIEHSAHDH